MSDLKKLADHFESIIKEHDLAKYTYALTESEKQEFHNQPERKSQQSRLF